MHESHKVVKGLGYFSEFLPSPRWSRKAQISEKYYLYFLSFKVLLRSKFNVKFVTKTLSFQLIRSGCTCFGHWNELWRPLSENIELENVGFSRPPLQIYVPVTKLLFSDCDVIFWTRQENKPEPWENSERFSKLRSSSPDSGIVKEEIVDYDDSVEPAPTEYEKSNTMGSYQVVFYAVCADGDSDYSMWSLVRV